MNIISAYRFCTKKLAKIDSDDVDWLTLRCYAKSDNPKSIRDVWLIEKEHNCKFLGFTNVGGTIFVVRNVYYEKIVRELKRKKNRGVGERKVINNFISHDIHS